MIKDIKPYRILIVEDNPEDFLLLTEYLKENMKNVQLVQASNYNNADQILSKTNELFDIVLLDLSLPDISKENLMINFKETCQTTPVLVLTGSKNIDYAIKSLAYDISDYLIKDSLNPTVLYKSIIYNIERFKIFKSLKASKIRYQDLFHLSPIPMMVFDTETYVFLDVNDAAIKNYGYSYKEFLSLTIKDIRPKEDVPGLDRAIKKISEGVHNYLVDTIRHTKKNGDIIFIDIKNNDFIFNNRKAKIAIATDITEKIKYIKAIQNQNKRLKDISWKQSHEVRVPLARLMSIIDLIKNGDLNNLEKKSFFIDLIQSSKELDEIIHSISSNTGTTYLDESQ